MEAKKLAVVLDGIGLGNIKIDGTKKRERERRELSRS